VKSTKNSPLTSLMRSSMAATPWKRAALSARRCTFAKSHDVRLLPVPDSLRADAAIDKARACYEHFGFAQLPSDPYHLFRLVKDIRAALKWVPW